MSKFFLTLTVNKLINLLWGYASSHKKIWFSRINVQYNKNKQIRHSDSEAKYL